MTCDVERKQSLFVIERAARPKNGKNASITTSGNYSSDNSSTVKQAALSGIGVYQGPNWLFGEEVAKGHLKEVLSDYEMEPFPIYLMHSAVNYLPRRLRALIEYLTHEFSLNPWVAGK